jgi:hypothetical protein
MKLEMQVCSLPLAKRLKELGVSPLLGFAWPLSVLCWWHSRNTGEWVISFSEIIDTDKETHDDTVDRWVPAFTVAELMEILPAGFFLRKHGDQWCVVGLGVSWTRKNGITEEPLEEIQNNIADAPAAMLIYLIKNKLINPGC